MEEWEIDFKWLEVRHYVKEATGKEELPDLNGILFMIGIQELGRWKATFTKEEKWDLMHIAVCRLLSIDGYYEFVGRDQDGWPHFKALRSFTQKGVADQETLLKRKVIQYFASENKAHITDN